MCASWSLYSAFLWSLFTPPTPTFFCFNYPHPSLSDLITDAVLNKPVATSNFHHPFRSDYRQIADSLRAPTQQSGCGVKLWGYCSSRTLKRRQRRCCAAIGSIEVVRRFMPPKVRRRLIAYRMQRSGWCQQEGLYTTIHSQAEEVAPPYFGGFKCRLFTNDIGATPSSQKPSL